MKARSTGKLALWTVSYPHPSPIASFLTTTISPPCTSMRLPRRTFKPCTSPYLAVTSNPYAAHSSRVPVVHQSFCPDLPGPPTKQWQACLHEHRGERVETPIGNRPPPHLANLRYCRQPVLFHSPTPPSIRPSVHPSFHSSCTSCRTVLVGIPPPRTLHILHVIYNRNTSQHPVAWASPPPTRVSTGTPSTRTEQSAIPVEPIEGLPTVFVRRKPSNLLSHCNAGNFVANL